MTFSRPRTLSLRDTDQAGFVYFGCIPSLAHSLYEEWVVEELGISWDEWFSNKEWIVPIRHMTVDYLVPLRGGSKISIALTIKEIKTHSFETTYLFSDQGKEVCRVNMIHVFCDRKKGNKLPIPLKLYPLLTRALQQKVLAPPSSNATISIPSVPIEN